MATLIQLRNRVDAWIDARLPAVQAMQEAFRASHGRYWQGLKTHSKPPEHTTAEDVDADPDGLDEKPTDEQETWRTSFPALASIKFPASLTCDTYSGPGGHGYVLTVRVSHNGKTYSRAINVGPETDRSYGWRLEEPDTA